MSEDKLTTELDNWHKTLRGEVTSNEVLDEDEKHFAESIRNYMLDEQSKIAPEGQKEETWELIQSRIKASETPTPPLSQPNKLSKILERIFKPSNLVLALSLCTIALIIPVLMQDKTNDEIPTYVTKGSGISVNTEQLDTKGLVSEYPLPFNEVVKLHSDLQKVVAISDAEPFYNFRFIFSDGKEHTLRFDKKTSQSADLMTILGRYEIIYFDRTVPQNFEISVE